MTTRKHWWLSGALLFLLLVAALPGAPGSQAQSNSRTFPETGKTVSGKFLDYWNTHGGLAQLGLPISDQVQETSPTDGKTYTMQYFERMVLELHPENAGTPFEVQGSLLGYFNYLRNYPQLGGAPDQHISTDNPYKFAETGKTIGGKFRAYWESHGGLAQQGYPVSEEFTEKSALDGKPYTVQYFQRAVFEYHPENQPPNDVLLSQLGTFENQSRNNLTFTDSTGTKVTLSKRPQRIVCLVSLCEDILFELGIDPVAVSDTFGQDPHFWGDKAKSFAQVGGSFAAPNLENIAKAQPDLVIGFIPHIGLRDALKNIAPLYIMNPANYQESLGFLIRIGQLTGRVYRAQQAVQGLLLEMQYYKSKAPNNKVPLIMFGRDVNFSIFTAQSLFGSVLSAVTNYPWQPGSGDVTAPDQEPGSVQYSVEKILQKDPDVILVETQGTGTKLSQILAANPIWSQLKAVQNNQVYEVNPNYYLFGRGTHSISIALADAMHKIYPDVFPTAP